MLMRSNEICPQQCNFNCVLFFGKYESLIAQYDTKARCLTFYYSVIYLQICGAGNMVTAGKKPCVICFFCLLIPHIVLQLCAVILHDP